MSVLAPRPMPGATGRPPLPRVDPITRLPILILYPHSRCNCRCVMCDIWKDTTRSELSPESIAGWITEWRSLGGHEAKVIGRAPAMLGRGQTLFPLSSQFAATFLLGCTLGGSPGIFG